MPTPPSSHPIRIKIYDINNTLLEGATVTLTLGTNEPISQTSNSKGEAVLNVANAGDWNVGDSVILTATKTEQGRKTSTLVLTSSPQTTSLTLEETSDLIYYEQTENDTYVLNFALLTTFDGEKVTHTNPLPVKVVDENGVNSNRQYTQVLAYISGTNKQEYIGLALPGTGKGEAKWQIKKLTYDGNKITDIQFAGGSDAFDKSWNNRTDFDYS